ncbi:MULTISPECIES: hypothetical protein, partial [unclassified Streptomyces]|uniref:hypothetical protein n=1 Tax=unclassified Streptomyces TaxID=2593676 RepID=UPI001EF059CB
METMKHIRPRVLIADIAFAENRLPVRRTTGILSAHPRGAAARPPVIDHAREGEPRSERKRQVPSRRHAA